MRTNKPPSQPNVQPALIANAVVMAQEMKQTLVPIPIQKLILRCTTLLPEDRPDAKQVVKDLTLFNSQLDDAQKSFSVAIECVKAQALHSAFASYSYKK